MDEIFIDLNFLTESERDQLQDVLARDDEFRRQEKKRLGDLKKDLETVKKSSAVKVSETSNQQPGKLCARCHQTFGVVFNTGAFCPKCKAKVCKSCRILTQKSWLCTLCAKVREVKAKSGAWFFDQVKTKNEARSLFGTSLIRASLKRRKFSSGESFDVDEMPTPPVIGLNNDDNKKKLHRPIPVHMSAIREKSNDGNDQPWRNKDQIMNEINQNNSKPYAKAIPVKKQLRNSFSDNEERETAEDSGNSTPTKLHYDDDEVVVTTNGRTISEEEKQKDNKEMFHFLDNIHHEMTSETRDQSHDPSRDKGLTSYGNDDDDQTPETSLEFHSLPADFEQPQHTTDHLNVKKTSERSTSIGSVDSYRTADFYTPTQNTPTQSLPGSDDESDFLDARDAATPVPDPEPETADEFHSLPKEEHFSYPESSQVRAPQPQIDVVPPQIITTAVEEPDEPHDVTDDNEEPCEDIDQAFAVYGSKTSLSALDRFEMGSRESIVSYYSDAGEGRFGNIPITGEVQFGLKYDHRAGRLEVQIHRARDIAPVDTKKNRSDPYVKVYLLPDKTRGGKRKTRPKKNTLNPEFDEILTFSIGFDEMLTRSMWLTVWNHDRFGHNDFLGEIIFPLDSYEQSGFSWDYPSAEWHPLQERRPEPSLMEYCGELVVALKYTPPELTKEKKSKKKPKKGSLYVAMVEAHNLPPKDSHGFSDPFCKAYLLPDKSKKTKRKTPTIKKNLNPTWNHTIVYENLTLEDLMDRVLELTVWDWDRGLSNSFLGGVRLGMGTLQEDWDDAEGNEIEAWQTMIDNPNEWNRFTLTLRSSMDSRVKTK